MAINRNTQASGTVLQWRHAAEVDLSAVLKVANQAAGNYGWNSAVDNNANRLDSALGHIVTSLNSLNSSTVALSSAARVERDSKFTAAVANAAAARTVLSGAARTERFAMHNTLSASARVERVALKTAAINSANATALSARNTLSSSARVERLALKVTAIASASAYTDSEIASLINSAPGALDTLKEIADALGNNTSLSASLATALAGHTNKINQNVGTISSLQSSLSSTQTKQSRGFGYSNLDMNGNWQPLTGTNYLNGNTSLVGELLDVDVRLAQNASSANTNSNTINGINNALARTGPGQLGGTASFRVRKNSNTFSIEFGTAAPQMQMTLNGNNVDVVFSKKS